MTPPTSLLVAAVALVAAIGLVIWDRWHVRRTMKALDAMLDLAISGDFTEGVYDESLLSAVETKLARYLSASAVSTRNLQVEKDQIKELIADISHQTKTPIANLLLYTQLLLEQDLPQETQTCLDALEQQTQRLHLLIESLVKTSRLEAGVLVLHPKYSPLMPTLEETVLQAAPKAAAKDISLTLVPTEESAVFDSKWTVEALYNLLDNAIKYTAANGHVTVEVTPYELFCRIDVTDTGMGIPEEEQTHIFRRFYRSPSVYETEGVGIGLYLVRQIATNQGGYVKVASQSGKGSQFSLF